MKSKENCQCRCCLLDGMKKLLLIYLFLVPSLTAIGQITYNTSTITGLRNAIISANSDGDVSIINLSGDSYTVGRFGNGPDGGGIAFPAITENFDLIINGDESDITVASTGTYRFFYVNSSGRLILNKMFLYNGQPEDDYAAGAVYNEGYLEANNVLFEGHSSGGNDGSNAGAIYNDGDAYFRTCEFVDNIAVGLGGLRGGAIFNTGVSSTLTVEQCTFYQNSAIGRGSALGINNGSVDVINSTFYENTDEAIYLSGGQLILNSCTISRNEANNFGGDNGTVVNDGGSLFLRYNVIGQNENSVGSLVIADPSVYDILGPFTDFGYNVIGQFNTGSLAGTSTTVTSFFFDFPSFGYNGSGFVRTIPLLASSPALDFVPTSQGSLPGYDQRGFVYEGAGADAGAYELNGTTITSIATGNWSEDGIWSNNDGPFSSRPAIIATGTVVTMDQNGSTAGLEIEGGGNLNAGTFNLSISGDFNASTSPSNSIANLSNANIFFTNVGTYTDPVGLDFGNVTVNGSSLSLANPLRARSMTINSTRTLNANANNIEIFGTGGTVWSQLGTFNPGGAGQTVTFNGAAPTINGTNFQSLTINSSGTATSLANLTMAEQLDVTAGSFVGGVLVQTNGDITINTSGNVDQSDMDSQGGDISVISTAGSLTLGDVTSDAGSITLNAAGDLNGVGQNITTNGGDLNFNVGGDLSLSGFSSASGSSGGDINLVAGGDMTLTTGIGASGGGTGPGNITMNIIGSLLATDGDLDITAEGQGGGNLTLTAFEILPTLNLSFSGPAGTGGSVSVTTTGPSDVVFSNIDVSGATESGDIDLMIGGGFSINNNINMFSAFNNSSFTATADGTVIVQNIDTGADGNAGDISITAIGDVTTGDLIADGVGTGGNITINTEGDISTADIRAEILFGGGTGGSIDLSALSGSISFNTISVDSPPGDGGLVSLKAGGEIVGLGTFTNLNGNSASISSVGSSASGTVYIEHNIGNPQDFVIGQGSTSNGLFSNLAADPSVASDNFLNTTVVGGNYISGDGRVEIRSPVPFTTTWQTTDGEITIPTTASGYNYNITWTNLTNTGVGDGSDSGINGIYTIPGLAAGDIYQVEIIGDFPRIYFNNGGDKDKILSIEQWGGIVWENMGSAFHGCSNLVYNASDSPDLSNVATMTAMFARCTSITTPDLSGWDVSGVLAMSTMFFGASNFNGNISSWNTSSVESINLMFNGASSFNQNLSGWDVSQVTVMNNAFEGATAFNNGDAPGASAIPLSWTTTSLENTNAMFAGATSFNQNINSWDVSNVTDMFRMFDGATVFNQPLDQWDVTQVISMGAMFKNAEAFNQPINSATWNTANVNNFGEMFFGALAFDQPLDNNWSLASAVNLVQMFAFASSFNQPLNQWGATKAGNAAMVLMFEGATLFNQPLDSWDVSGVDNMFGIFKNATAFNQDLNAWDVSGVTIADSSMEELFDNTGISTANYEATLIGWSAQPVQSNITLGALGLTYCDPTGRDLLTGVNSWTINGDEPLVDPAALPLASASEVCDNDFFDFSVGAGAQTGYTYRIYSGFVDLGNRGDELGVWVEGTPAIAITLTDGTNGIVVGTNTLTIVAEDDAGTCETVLNMTLSITVTELPTATITGDATICEGESTDLSFALTGSGPFEVTYNNGTSDILLSGVTDGQLEQVSPIVTTTYSLVSIADANACSPSALTGTVTVTVNPIPTVVIAGDAVICEGESIELVFDLTGTAPFDVTYNDGSSDTDLVGINSGHIETVSPTSTTSYTLVSVSDNNGCSPASVSGVATITINPAPTATITGDASICEGETSELVFNLTGTGPFDVIYNDGSADVTLEGINDGHLESITPINTTTYTLVSIMDVNGCTASSSGTVIVEVNPEPTVSLEPQGPFCTADDLVTLAATPAGGEWSGNGITDELAGTFDPSSLLPGSYTITYRFISPENCSAEETIDIEVLATPAAAASINGEQILCTGDEATFTTTQISGADEYQWETPDETITTAAPEVTFTPVAAGEITVAGINSCGAGALASTTYALAPELIANFDFTTSQTSDLEYLFTDTSLGDIDNWAWTFGDGATSNQQNPSHTFDAQGDFTVSLTISNGVCEDNASQTINVSTEILIRIGNVITPNNNGQNDFIYIENIEKYPDHEVQLLNRWGKEIFTTSRFSNSVEEMSGLPDLKNGNYVCRVIIRFGGSEVQQQQVISVIE